MGKFKEILHDPEIYGGRVAYFKMPTIRGKVSIFTSGKMISVGEKSEREAKYALESAKDFLTKKGVIRNKVLRKTVVNIVATSDFGCEIDLEKLTNNRKMIYEPEQFPGGILRLQKPCKAVVLLFASGKAVITGLQKTSQVRQVADEIAAIISTS